MNATFIANVVANGSAIEYDAMDTRYVFNANDYFFTVWIASGADNEGVEYASSKSQRATKEEIIKAMDYNADFKLNNAEALTKIGMIPAKATYAALKAEAA